MDLKIKNTHFSPPLFETFLEVDTTDTSGVASILQSAIAKSRHRRVRRQKYMEVPDGIIVENKILSFINRRVPRTPSLDFSPNVPRRYIGKRINDAYHIA